MSQHTAEVLKVNLQYLLQVRYDKCKEELVTTFKNRHVRGHFHLHMLFLCVAIIEAPAGGGTLAIGNEESGESYEEAQQQSPCMWGSTTAQLHNPSAALFPPSQYTYNEVVHPFHHPFEKQLGRESHPLTHPPTSGLLDEEAEEGRSMSLKH